MIVHKIKEERMTFIGICAGAFLGIELTSHLGLSRLGRVAYESPETDANYGQLDPCKLDLTQDGIAAFGLNSLGDASMANGPIIASSVLASPTVAQLNVSNVKVLASFALGQFTDKGYPLGGKPAAVAMKFGRGTMALIAPHFLECNPKYINAGTFNHLVQWCTNENQASSPAAVWQHPNTAALCQQQEVQGRRC